MTPPGIEEEGRAPGPSAVWGQGRPPGNLPVELSSFVGRQREISELKGLLAADGTRLLTLTGPGGGGKTRLATAVAFEVVEGFEDGVWWVGLASLSDPTLVPQALASALEVREASGRPLTETLVEHLKPKRTLLVLDNCEHLIDACAALVDTLLRSCPGLKILATSREALGVAGERVWVVPPLASPDPLHLPPVEELARYEAVRLFVERAEAASRFELTEENASTVAQLCNSLDGVPLAIELAAARTKVLSVGQILGRLEDSLKLLAGTDRTAPARRRTLRATLDWSHELLDGQERKLFRRLSVFAGGWTLEAAEAVGAGDGIEQVEVLDLLSGLVDKSMVVAGAGAEGALRYRMLEPVRQYGLERLEESGEARGVRELHARHYLTLAEQAEPQLRDQEAWLERLEKEHDNFRAALSWALDRQEVRPDEERAEVGLRLAAALAQGRFWNAYGPSEGRRWLERGLARSGTSPGLVRAKALREAGWIAIFQGDFQQAVALLEEGLALYKELEDKPGVTTSLVNLGLLALHGGDHELARKLGQEAEALRQELADRQVIGFLLIFLGMIALDEGDHDRAVALLEESLALNQDLGDVRGVAMCLTFLGTTVLERGDPERAASLFEEDMRILRGLRDKTGTAYGLRGLAGVAALRGEPTRAARLWGADEALREAAGLVLSPFERSHPDYEGYQAAARSRLDEAAWESAWSEGRAMTQDEAIEYALKTEEPASPLKETAGLTERELEILRLVAEGLTDSQVAQRLYLSPRTVGQHLRSIYRKLGVPSRAAAAKEAAERSLI